MSQHIVKSVKLMVAIKLAAVVFTIGVNPWLGAFGILFAAELLFCAKGKEHIGPLLYSLYRALCHIASITLLFLIFDFFYAAIGGLCYVVVFVLPLDLLSKEQKPTAATEITRYEKEIKIYDAEVVDD